MYEGELNDDVTMALYEDRKNKTVWNFYNKLFSLWFVSAQSFKSKFETSLFWWSWGKPQRFDKKIINMQCLGKNQPIVGTLFTIFIAQQDLHDSHTLESKSILHLHMFPRKYNSLNCYKNIRLHVNVSFFVKRLSYGIKSCFKIYKKKKAL